MKIVINIDDSIYDQIIKNYNTFPREMKEAYQQRSLSAIKNGTPLPKGHGRLIDADVLLDQISKDKREAFTKHQVWLLVSQYSDYSPTIIESNKGSEVDK